MLVIYRMTSIPSTNPSPFSQDDKDKLNEFCLKLFVKAFESVKPKIIFLLDYCNSREMIERSCPFEYEIQESRVGQNETMLRSYELASQVDDYVLFQECDYLYQSGVGKTYLQALKELGLVSPYDHLNFYKDRNLHSETCKLRLVNETHFRSTERNTMTWGCHSDLIKKYRHIFDKYGYLDGDVWYDLKREGVEMWVPIPSFATHMVKDWLAPSINWSLAWTTL